MNERLRMRLASGGRKPPNNFVPRRWPAFLFALALVAFVQGHCSFLTAAELPHDESNLTRRVDELVKEKGIDEARAYVQAQIESGLSNEIAARLLFRVAKSSYRAKKYDIALVILTDIVERHKDSTTVSTAWCALGQVYHRLGDDQQMLAALEMGFATPQDETRIHDADVSDSHTFACEILGAHYMRRQEWAKALAIWQVWNPSSWCGTCNDQMEAYKRYQTALCQLQLGQHRIVARALLDQICTDVGNEYQRNAYTAYLVYRLYEQAGQKDELLRIARTRVKGEQIRTQHWPEENRTPRQLARIFPAHAILYCEELNQLAERRDYDGLLAALNSQEMFGVRGIQNWQSRAAADAFVRCGAEGMTFLAQTIEQAEHPRAELFYALARFPGPEAAAALQSTRLGSSAFTEVKLHLFLALRIKEPETLPTVQLIEKNYPRFVEITKPDVDAALSLINAENGWPAPKPNSLPNEIDLTIESLEKLFERPPGE